MRALISFVLLASAFTAFAADPFPTSPHPKLTPGSVCKNGGERRYPEKILYCNRNVDSTEKRAIIAQYDRAFGHRIGQMNRNDFKIDHYIPLCMGGSNDTSNLWPQHASVYVHTDPLEEIACKKMAEGRLRQADAIQYIRKAKADPMNASTIVDQVKHL